MKGADGKKLDRWTVWAPRLAAAGFAIPAGGFTLFACFILAMAGLPLTGMLTFPLGIAAIAACVGAMTAWAPDRPVGLAFASLFGLSAGWLFGATIFFGFPLSPVMDRDPIYGLPLGWGVVGLIVGPNLILWRRRAGSSCHNLAGICQVVGATVPIVLVILMLFQSYRLVTYEIPQAGERIGVVQLDYHTACLAVSPDGTIFASGGRMEDHGIVCLVNAATSDTREWKFAHSVRAVAFSPAQPVLAIGCRSEASSFVCLWDLETSTELRQIEVKRRLINLSHSPDGRYLNMLAWDDDSQMVVLSLWQTDSWTKCFDLETEAGLVPRLGALEDEVSDNAAKTANDKSYLIAREATAFSPDGRSIAIARITPTRPDPCLLEIWSLQKQKIHSATLRLHDVQYLTFLPHGEILLAGHAVALYDPASGKLHELPYETAPRLRPPTTPARCFGKPRIAAYLPQACCWSVSRDGQVLASGGGRIVGGDGFPSYANTVLSDVQTGKYLGEILFEEINTSVQAVAVSPSGKTLALVVLDSWPPGSPERLEWFDIGATTGGL